MIQPSSLPLPPTGQRARRRRAPSPEIVLIGASTGGPQALVALISGLASVLPQVVVCVTLHLPADLMHVVADHVARTCRVPSAVVAGDGRLEAGLVHFAPGDRHLVFERSGAGIRATLDSVPTDEVCSSAVDAMFRSAASCYGARVLGVVLSGMGKDGLEGARAIVAAGGAVIVQDKATSAVWGMPGAVAKADLAAAVLEPAAMARDIVARTIRVGRFP